MNKLLLITIVFSLSLTVNAQIQSPLPSPNAKVEQVVGLTNVKLEYSRPSMRGRTIFGDLVPYGKIWRTGANLRTKVTFSEDVIIDKNELQAGTYAIFTIPGVKQWDVIFYSEHDGFEAPQILDKNKISARIIADVKPLQSTIQSLTISIDNLSSESAIIGISWENSYVGITFKVSTDKVVMSSIDKALSGPGSREYFLAASYYYNEEKDLKKAKEWIDKALSMTSTPRYWELRQQALIYAAIGNKKEAIAIAKTSLKLSEEANDADYIKLNKKSIAEWID